MSTKLQRHGFFCSSSSNRWVSRNSVRNHLSIIKWGISRKRCLAKLVSLDNGKNGLNIKLVGHGKHYSTFRKSRRMGHCSPSASAEDGITVNGSSQTGTSSDLEEMRVKLKQSLQGEDFSNGLVQSLNDAARVFELAIKEQGLFSKLPWFSTAWLGVDRNAWVKTLSYQASVYCLLQAASEISSRGDNRDRDVNVFVQRSLLRQSAPLESLIREKLSAKQPEFYDWFSTEQVPAMVSSFVHYFEGDPQFSAATAMCGKGASFSRGGASDISLLMLSLTCLAAITKLGPAKVSCLNFSSMIPDITGRLMDMLVDFVPIYQAYISMKDIGLRREFLVHFGPRATECRVNDDRGSEEVSFWVDLVQNQLQRAIDREKIWSRLTTSESIEVLDRDLAIFGFFIALGRSTKSFLSANGFEVLEGPIEGFIRYLIGGSVLFYPQLSSISSYQLYVEVVCEELDWLPFYPGNSDVSKQSHGHRSKREGPPNAEAIPQVLDVCSHWIESFIKYSTWLENPSNVKAAKFLSRGHNKLMECKEELRLSNKSGIQTNSVEWAGSAIDMDSDSFNKALESVEEALNKLENLLEELHVDSSYSGKEQLKEACSDLEKIRKLKKEAEFLEASFRAKAASLEQDDDDDDDSSQSSITEQQQYWKGRYTQSVNVMDDGSDRSVKKSRGFWSSLTQLPFRKDNAELTAVEKSEDEVIQQSSSIISATDAEPNEIDRFEQLRNELMELEKRVKKSADQSENEELTAIDVYARSGTDAGDRQLVKSQKKENIIGKSLDKLKETSTDVLQGTQLLAIDAAAATGLLRRVLIGDDLTEKEKQALKRTLTDLASVVPIGILMLLPVTAVGHAAMLAAIQRYVPSLIPSTYGTERLDLLRQLEKMKEMETSEPDPEENVGELI